MNAIFARKSVRSYTDRPVSREDLHDLLHAGMSAPTAMNDRPWQFILVTDKALLAKLPIKLRVVRFVFLQDVVDGSQQHSGDGDNRFLVSSPLFNSIVTISDFRVHVAFDGS